MSDAVTHRGPDDAGLAYLASAEVTAEGPWTTALGHRRLAILDLSATGHQPMSYRDRLWITYNGEVYNYLELRAELERAGHRFRSTSDTEVVLATYAEWGAAGFARMRGMWGFVLVDLARQEAVFCRDRLGIKPLYYWRSQELVAAASEIKQFLAVPGFRARLAPAVAHRYLATGYEDAKSTFFDGVVPIPAATWVKLSLRDLKLDEPVDYWHPQRVRPEIDDAATASRLLAAKLGESVALHLRSDVAVGSALSGGLDSSALTVLMNRAAPGADLHTFTCSFPGDALDERGWAETAIAGLRVLPHFVTPTADRFADDLERFIWIHDEPVGSLSMYAGYCLARLTREHAVKVTVNGQGGDEAMSGYWQSYFMHLRNLGRRARLLAIVRHLAGALSWQGNPDLVGQIPVMLRRYRSRRGGAALLGLGRQPGSDGPLDAVMAMDEQARRVYEIRQLFLPRLLKWDDRNSMAFSVEGRYPFLDHELLELCLSFTPELLYRDGWTKWPLREALRGVLPEKVRMRRSKLGFEVPQDRWLHGPLRPAIERWLASDDPAWQVVSRDEVRDLAARTWGERSGLSEQGQALFRVFMLGRWMARFQVSV
jgi:asparagine synthase (glutamine-hydrolysing)